MRPPERAPSGVPLVDVYRGAEIESVHAVAACAVTARGEVLLARGDVDVPVYLRSSWKPFIAATVVASGAARRYDLSDRELAVMCASHNGEPFHVAAVSGILKKLGLVASALQCGALAAAFEPAAETLCACGVEPSALHNNCSGKHAGILAMCLHLGFDPGTYLEREHPAQQRILAFCGRIAGADLERAPLGVDGCGIPVAAVSLTAAALAFARLACLDGVPGEDLAALAAVRNAMASEPAYVGGTGRFDSALIAATGGRIVCKAGAEGVHCDALVRERAGLALKVVDGSRRATAPAAVAFLKALGGFEPRELESLAAYAQPDVRNVAGRVVGRVSARDV